MELATLESQIKVVAEARQKAASAKLSLNTARREWEEENEKLICEDGDARTACQVAEDALRELTLKVYTQTGNKSPAKGVGIREVTKLEYDANVAFNWATEHVMALKLDISAFEKIVKVSPLDFVKVITEPQATIASQLE